MNEYPCKTWQQLFSMIEEHDCGEPEILCADDPRNHKLGFCCVNCRAWFWLIIDDLKSKVPSGMYPFFQTQEGRIKMARSFGSFRITVCQEQEI